ncbi:MAG: 3-oxoacyl-ACP synthase [Legionellaceae bacterium]|nr:3-oxoacyl-ACP synthase [Legionellaceae bacterium]|tara:strand:+ start:716 stop:1684 length:969 start_codon:yes stop_codon:yes gene_type:complete
MNNYARILGTGSYLPEKILTNHDLEKMVDTSDEWIVSRSGIRERHIAAKDESASSMALIASQRAIEAAGLSASDIDMIIVGTCSPDMLFPSAACFLQAKLGLSGIPAFDVGAACSGFVYALSVANQFIRGGEYKKILVVGSEVISRSINWEDRSTCVLFADGAGAVVVGADNKPGIKDMVLHSDGKYADILNLPSPHYKDDQDEKLNCFLHMEGREVYKIAVTELPNTVLELLERNKMHADEIDWLVPHQANLRIIEFVAKRLNFPMEKVIVTVDKHANTSSASVPLAFDEAVRSGKIKRGDTVIMEAFGGGITWGGVLLEF